MPAELARGEVRLQPHRRASWLSAAALAAGDGLLRFGEGGRVNNGRDWGLKSKPDLESLNFYIAAYSSQPSRCV